MSKPALRWTPERGWHTLTGKAAREAQQETVNRILRRDK